MTTEQQIENLYAIATSPKLEKKIHHRYVPMMMYAADGKEVVLPMVVGTSREMRDIESGAEKETRASLGETTDKGKGSTWYKVMSNNRDIGIIYTCTRMPGDLNKKFFESKQQVEDTYGPDELGTLIDHYATVRYTQPHYVLMDKETDSNVAFQKVIDKIKAMGEESDFFLNSFTTHSSNQLIKYLVSHHTSSENITGVSGTLSNNTTKTE